MRYMIAIALLTLPLMGVLSGCQKKEGGKELHFGPNPGDSEADERNAQEMNYGPSPGDGATDEEVESLNFGPSPGDG